MISDQTYFVDKGFVLNYKNKPVIKHDLCS